LLTSNNSSISRLGDYAQIVYNTYIETGSVSDITDDQDDSENEPDNIIQRLLALVIPLRFSLSSGYLASLKTGTERQLVSQLVEKLERVEDLLEAALQDLSITPPS
jgi:hypothetical protein